MSFQLRYVQEVDGEHEVVVKIRSGVACCCCCCCCLSCWLVWLERRNTKNFLPPFIPRAAKTILAAAPIFRRRARAETPFPHHRTFIHARLPSSRMPICGYFWKQWEEVPYWRSRGNATPVFFSLSLETEAVGKVGGDAVSLRGLLASTEARFLQELGGKPE
jgi:hypothetical protein